MLVDPQTRIATAFNRSLRFGDGLFETMFWDGYQIRNENFHLDRLFHSLSILHFDFTSGFTRQFISEEIHRLCLNNAPEEKARIRLNAFREDGGLLLPENNRPVFLIESATFPEQNQSSLRLTIFEAEKKYPGILSNLKTNNYLLFMMALQYAKENGFDDALVLNSSGNCCEAGSSNLFMVLKGIIYTPALTEGCVAGTKRRQLLEQLPSLGFQIKETSIGMPLLFEMEEVFLTNAIRGISPVRSINDHVYQHELTDMLIRLTENQC